MSDLQENNTRGRLSLHPIGFYSSSVKQPYQAGRQPDEHSEPGTIEFLEGLNFEQALSDLDTVSHIWIIFGFHHNENWKPKVQTPRSQRKIGVFATRAPYRPNPIGLSVVQVLSVDGLKVKVSGCDLLDGTPIYDIKPYHPESDFIQNSHIGWLHSDPLPQHQIRFSPNAQEQIDWLETHGLKEIHSFIFRQLEFDPTNDKKKRVEYKNGLYCLSYRTWRIDFSLAEQTIGIIGIRSGYSAEELQNTDDTYQDKELHRKFIQHFES